MAYISISFPSNVYKGESTSVTASCDELPETYTYYRLYTYLSGTYSSYGSVSPTYSSTFYSKGKLSQSLTFTSSNTASSSRTCYVYCVLQGSNSSSFSSVTTIETKSGSVSFYKARSSQSWTISPTSVTLTPGGTQTLTLSGTTYGTVSYSTSKSSVATVSNKVITAVATGSATITVTAAGSTTYQPLSRTCTVTVSRATVAYPTITNTSLTYAVNSSTGAGVAQGPTITNKSSYLTQSGTASATNVGTYTVSFTPDSTHQWSDGTYGTKSTTWTIGEVRRFYIGSNAVVPYINGNKYRAYIYDSSGWHILNT